MKFFFILISLFFSSLCYSQSSGTKARKIISVGIMALSSSTTQGGTGPTGSSILTSSDFVWAYHRIGYGAVFNYDLHGSNEKDSSYGIKIETYLSNFYLEVGYLLSAKRAYTDRSIASETGTGLFYGLGARFPLKSGGNGPFFHASYKFRTQTLTKQDGVDLTEPIQQQDGYPLFGFGFTF